MLTEWALPRTGLLLAGLEPLAVGNAQGGCRTGRDCGDRPADGGDVDHYDRDRHSAGPDGHSTRQDGHRTRADADGYAHRDDHNSAHLDRSKHADDRHEIERGHPVVGLGADRSRRRAARRRDLHDRALPRSSSPGGTHHGRPEQTARIGAAATRPAGGPDLTRRAAGARHRPMVCSKSGFGLDPAGLDRLGQLFVVAVVLRRVGLGELEDRAVERVAAAQV